MGRPSLAAALQAVTARFGAIDVLEYSPAPHTPGPGITTAAPSQSTVENLQPQIEYNFYGALEAARAVLPAMREAGAGTLLFTTGGGSVDPIPMLGNVNAAAAALRDWVINLNNELTTGRPTAAPASTWRSCGPSVPGTTSGPRVIGC